ncbi:hypothetical protein SH1V18_48030 [Vallitalea longa]|uniref:Uncharacterized protein n=1 Tax=Vallitalea longa TaxID=2936439 RepID=A0A9W5YJ67_9FIRM|nr:hypothetical protein [Vallitalea longa]GKX32323.1 hypothetical protein SH1V18_48030 [Vallitalea longa]
MLKSIYKKKIDSLILENCKMEANLDKQEKLNKELNKKLIEQNKKNIKEKENITMEFMDFKIEQRKKIDTLLKEVEFKNQYPMKINEHLVIYAISMTFRENFGTQFDVFCTDGDCKIKHVNILRRDYEYKETLLADIKNCNSISDIEILDYM